MEKIKKGDKVKMSEMFKAKMMGKSSDHITEFGNCEGYVGDLIFPDIEDSEVDVYWEPSGLKYGYDTKDLVKVMDMNRSKEDILMPYVETPFSHTKIVEKDNALKAMGEYGEQESNRRERLAYLKGREDMSEIKDKEIKELELYHLEPKDWEPKQDSKLMEQARKIIELERIIKN